jgi:hypothetical protein
MPKQISTGYQFVKNQKTNGKKTPKLIDSILAEFEESSSMATREACKKHGISLTIWNRWLNQDEELVERYARAKEAQSELMVNEMISISDDPDLDANSKRVMVDTRKWIASKLKPKKYGDKVQQEITGSDNGPVKIELVNFVIGDNGNVKNTK